MAEAYLFLIIFGAALLLAAASLWFSKDPRNSVLLGRMPGIGKMEKEEAVRTARIIASAVAGVGLALIVFFLVKWVSG